MITFLSRMNIKPEKQKEFCQLVEKLTAAVHANEPETLAYQFYKLRDQPLGYAVFESFVNEAAEEHHLNTPHFKQLATPMIECLDGAYVREYLDPID